MHRLGQRVVRCVRDELRKHVVADDRRQVAEHAFAGLLVLQPGRVVSAAQRPQMMVRVDDLAFGHTYASLSSLRVRKRCAVIAAITATPKMMLRTPAGMLPITSTVERMVVKITAAAVPA